MADEALLDRIRRLRGEAPQPKDRAETLRRIRSARERVQPEVEAKKRALESYTPDTEEQERRMEPPTAAHFGTRMATQPGFELVSEPAMIAAEKLGADDLRNRVTETAAEMAEGDPEMAGRLRYREKVAKADAGGRVLAGAKAAEAALPFAFAPAAPKTILALTALGSTKTGEKVLAAPADLGGAIARGLGAEEGGAGEAVGRLAVPLAALGLSAKTARAAGRSGAPPAAAARLSALPLREVVPAAAKAVREGGVRALAGPAEAAHAASTLSGAAGMTMGPDVARALDLDPEGPAAAVANVGTQLGVGALQSSVEGRAMRAGERSRRLSDLLPVRKAAQAARTDRIAGEAMEGVPGAIDALEATRAGRNASLKDILRETVATEQAKRAADRQEARANLERSAAEKSMDIARAKEAPGKGLEEAVEGVAERMKAPKAKPVIGKGLLGAADVLDAPAGAILKVGDRRGKVVVQSEDGATVQVSFEGGKPETIRASEAEVVWKPGDTPEVAYDQPLVSPRKRSIEPPPPEATVEEGRPVSEGRHARSLEGLREREGDLLPQVRQSKADDMARAYEEMFPEEAPPAAQEAPEGDLPARMAAEAEKMLAEPERIQTGEPLAAGERRTAPPVKPAATGVTAKEAPVEGAPVAPEVKPVPAPAADAPLADRMAAEAEKVIAEPPAKPKRKAVPIVEGSEVEVTTASKDTDLATVKGRYAVVEAADLLPSHRMDGGKFEPEGEYPQEIQPTRYESDEAAAETTRGFRGKFDPNEVLSTAPGVEGGAPTIAPDGVVLNGNGRAMIVKDLYSSGEGASYKDAVLSRAEQFGLDLEAVSKMESPVLVRVADVPEARRKEFAAVGNVSRMKRGSVVAESEKWSRIFPDDIIETFGDDPNVTLGEALNASTAEAAEARRRILAVLPEGERNVYYNPKTDRLTPEGQALVREVALRKAGISRETVERAEPQVQKAVEAAAVPLAQLQSLFPNQHIGKQVEQALEFYRVHVQGRPEGTSKESALADALAQEALPGLGEKASMDPAPRMVMDFVLKNAETPVSFRAGFRALVDALQTRGSLFPMTDKEMTSHVATALGVTERKGAQWGPKSKNGIVLGAGLGGAQAMPAHRLKSILGSVLGATGGYVYSDETGQDELSEKLLYAGLGAMAGYRIGGGKRGLVDVRRAMRGMKDAPYSGPVVKALESALRWNPATIGPAFAEVIRGGQRERLLGDYRAMKKAHALPELPDGDRATVYRHLMGEKGADADFQSLLSSMPADKADALETAASNIKRTVQRLADDAVKLGRLSPESRDEYANGWLQRIYVNDLMKGASVYRRFKGNKPAIIENRIRQDGYGLVLDLDAPTVDRILAASGAGDPVIVLQKGKTTLIKWEDSPEGAAARDKFLNVGLKPYARGQSVMKIGPGKKGGTGHLATRVKGQQAVAVDLTRQGILKVLVEAGILKTGAKVADAKAAGIDLALAGQKFKVTFADAQKLAKFEAALGAKAAADSQVAVGPGAKGGVGHLLKMEFDPLSMQQRKALGETFDPKASSELTLARMAWQNSNARMLKTVKGLSDAKGDYSKSMPMKPDGKGGFVVDRSKIQNLKIDGQDHEGFRVGDVEYVVAPDTYGWGDLKNRGVRRDAFEYLNETRNTQGKFDEFLDGFMGKWKGAKILTPIGLMRNVWSNFFWYAPAMGVDPLNPANLHYFTKALKMLRSTGGLARIIKDVGADPHIGDRPDIIEGSEAVYQQIRRGSSEEGGARKVGEFFGDLLTGGATMEGQKSHVLALIRAGLGGTVGALGAEEGERLQGAAYGAGIGLAAGPAIRKIRALYSSIDPLFKTAAYLKHLDGGKSKVQAREEVRKFSQVFSEPGKVTKWSQGKGDWSGRLLGNPFVSFQVENARITANLAKEKPALLAALMLRKELAGGMGLLALAAVGADGLPGTREDEQVAARRAFPNLTMGPVPIVGANGKVRMFDTSQLLPGATDAEGIQTLLGSPETGKAFREQVFRLGLSNPILSTLWRAGATAGAGPEAKDPRTGLPLRKRGEGKVESVVRRTGEELLHPYAPGVGVSFRKLADAGLMPGIKGKKYEDNLRFEKRRPGWTAFEQGTGIRTRDLDFRPVRSGITNQERFDAEESESRTRSDLRDPNLKGPEARRLVIDFQKELKAIREKAAKRRRRELPAGAEK